MRRRILGTAGHIDHGKTALVAALTGVDTDRLQAEKDRGITIDLGFAPLDLPGGVRMGVVDVPGHEAFVRNMLAGASGVDVVLLVVAADEGVMPQTREHLAIVDLLGVEGMVVALTKADRVEEAWLDLVREEVAETLGGTRFAGAPTVATSVEDARGIEELRSEIGRAAEREEPSDGPAGREEPGTLARLPLDRVFTVRGTGTVVTGTLRDGPLESDGRVRILPAGLEARIRGLEVHGEPVERALPGERTAVALSGPGMEKDALSRGDTLLVHPSWRATTMLTVRLRVLPTTGWSVEQGQRVRVHLGTAEVMARCAVLGPEPLLPGGEGWVQLRLERPLVARAGDPFVVRAYSPVTTIGGGRVAEPLPEKRTRLEAGEAEALDAVLDGEASKAELAVLLLAGWEGVEPELLPILTGRDGADRGQTAGASVDLGRILHPDLLEEGRDRILAAIDDYHRREPLRPGIPLERLRTALPARSPAGATGVILDALEREGRVSVEENVAARPDFRITLTSALERAREGLRTLYREAGLAPPPVEELPRPEGGEGVLWALLKLMEREGELVTLEEGVLVWGETLRDAARRTVSELGGRRGLGPADFRPVLGVSRKHLLPLLGHFDRSGVTVRREGGREVATDLPDA